MAALNGARHMSTSLLIDPARLSALLGEAAKRFNVIALAECESTNTLCSWTVLPTVRVRYGAEYRRIGRRPGAGAVARHWMASPESSLTFSVLWAFPGGLERLSGLSLAVGVAVVRALENCGASGCVLKWPNDILHGHAKLGGILVELRRAG